MATIQEITSSLKTIQSAGLRNGPADKEAIANTAVTWAKFLADVPGQALEQAVNDLVLSCDFWPSIKQVREAARQVVIHNGASAAVNHFKDETRTEKIVEGAARITKNGWEAVVTDPTAIGKGSIPAAPDWVLREDARLRREIGDLLGKRPDDWSAQDQERYQRAIGAKYGSLEEAQYWEKFFAYLDPLKVSA